MILEKKKDRYTIEASHVGPITDKLYFRIWKNGEPFADHLTRQEITRIMKELKEFNNYDG